MRREIIGFFFMNVPINITEARKSVKIKSIKNIFKRKSTNRHRMYSVSENRFWA